MTSDITVSREQVGEIFGAIDGICELLKKLPASPELAGVVYGIMSNLSVIQGHVGGVPRVTSN